jgi:hypothetical protein
MRGKFLTVFAGAAQPYASAFRMAESRLDGREPLNIAMRDSEISQLISRLKLCKHLDANLIAAVNRHVADDLKSIAKVRLRNARFVPADNKLGFLVKLFEKMPSENEHFVECLDFALGFLDEQQNDPDIFPALMRKKKFYYKTLQKALKFESQLNRSNMETLMLQGKRAAFVDKNEARKNMRIIDIISRAVFGKTEYYDRLDVHGEVFEQNTCRDIDDIIHMFSDPEDSGP